MSIENGTTFNEPSASSDLTQAIAQSIVGNLRGTAQKASGPPVLPQGSSWTDFASTLDQLVSSNAELKAAVEETMAHSARQALMAAGSTVPSTEDFLAMLRSPPVAGKGGTIVRTFWWGFNINVSHDDLNAFVATAGPLVAITAALGIALGGPAAPFITAVAAFIAGMLALLKALDRGRGVCIGMCWWVPGAFIPSSL